MTDTPKNDPHAEREAASYQNPVASREFLLQLFDAERKPLTHPQVCSLLGEDDPERVEALRRRLRAMERDGQLVSNRQRAYGRPEKMDLVAGRVIGHRDGFGFLVPDEGGDDFYLSAKQMRLVFDGDRALVSEISSSRRSKKEGKIVSVIARNTQQLTGRYFLDGGTAFFRADNQKISQDLLMVGELAESVIDGQVIVVNIVQQPSAKHFAQCEVSEVLGDHMAPGMEIDIALRSHNIPFEWSAEVDAAVKKIKPELNESDYEGRVDLRMLPFVTIDGEDARDFDDAVYCEKKPKGGWRLYVAIADVAHYVERDQALDKEAYERGNSVYFPSQVIPMLPEVLSNGLCSLNPHVDRLCMVCEMQLSEEGVMTRYKFYEAVIYSHHRMTYTEVGNLIGEPDSDEAKVVREKVGEHESGFWDLYELYLKLRYQREIRGAIDFDTTETRIVFTEDRKIDSIVPVQRNDAHKLIEECMLCANQAAAKLTLQYKLPVLYRNHEGPTGEKLEALNEFLQGLGLQLSKRKIKQVDPGVYQAFIHRIKDRVDFDVIQTVMLRSLKQAVYAPENKGHFGLAYESYGHFTSPIRRYPDLLLHRAVKQLIHSDIESTHVQRVEGAKPAASKGHSMAAMLEAGEHCSMTERRADEASRDVASWLKCEYMQDHLGDSFSGVISAVTGFGMFVMLDEIYVEGLVHISSLASDYYHHNATHHELVGENNGNAYRLGDTIQVKVAAVHLDERKIDFELLENPSGRKKASRGNSKKKHKQKNTADKIKLDEARGEKKGAKSSAAKKGPKKKASNKKSATKGSESKKSEPKSSAPKKPRTKKPRRKKTSE